MSVTLLAQNRKNEILQKFNDYKYYNTYEFAYLKPDKRIFYSGESLEFNASVLNQYFSHTDLSKILHVDLLHESNNVSKKFILRLNSGSTEGLINIPRDIPSGNYQMVAYTEFMRNQNIEYLSHRVPIYIQNVLEAPSGKVVRNINPEATSNGLIDKNDQYRIDIAREPNHLSLKISTLETGKFYVVSEGLKSIQFIAELDAVGSVSGFNIPRSQLKGGFQRLILLDSNLDVRAVRCFYLKNNRTEVRKKYTANSLELNVQNNLISKIVLDEKKNVLEFDSISLFKRIYRFYYNLPFNEDIEYFNFEELISDSKLKEYSTYSYTKWQEIVGSVKTDSKIKYYPEKNIQLNGRVEGDSDLIEESNIAIHFFENEIDVTHKLDLDGRFSLDLILPSGQDNFKISILDNSARDISEKMKIMFDSDSTNNFSYLSSVSFYPKEVTDSILNSNIEFKYILSTFSNAEVQRGYFWDNIKFDESIRLSDYFRGIENFEEFIKEAVMNVSVAEKQGSKILKMYNSGEGTFDKPQLIVVDNKVLKNTSPLFDIPLDSIESIKTAYTTETLRSIGKTFVKGIIVIRTKEGSYEISDEDLDENFVSFTGYNFNLSTNDVSDRFDSSGISDFIFTPKKVYQFDESLKGKKRKLVIESLSKEGTYDFSSEEVNKQ
ncbi:hypothetical protein [Ekhidna sp.]